METRLINLNSRNADLGGAQQANRNNFELNLGNNTTDLSSRIVGFSVESVSFVNLLPNVRPGWTFTVREQLFEVTDEIKLTIPGDVFYNIESLASALQTAWNEYQVVVYGPLPPVLTITVAVGAGPNGGDLLQFEQQDAYNPPGLVTTILGDGPLAYAMGIPVDGLLILRGEPGPYEPNLVRTNLNGEHAVVLQTRQITGARTSLDGNGRSTAAIITVPITVPYGAVQTLHVGGTERPTTVYGPQTQFDLNRVDMALHYLDGGLAFLDNTDMSVSLRVWLRSK